MKHEKYLMFYICIKLFEICIKFAKKNEKTVFFIYKTINKHFTFDLTFL